MKLIDDPKLQEACLNAANAAVDSIIEIASEYSVADKQASMTELNAILIGQRAAVIARVTERAFQAAAETLDPDRFAAEEESEWTT